jgi:hypothetical protein
VTDPEPVTDDDGNVLGYECPTCGTLKTTATKANKHCSDTEPTTPDAPGTPPSPGAAEAAGDPEKETDESGTDDQRARARAAFMDAIEWFHTNLDQDLPEECEYATPRAYFTEQRSWDETTIDEKLVGYAPPSRTALLDHLMAQGYDRDAILGTGLFWDDLTPIWRGRYVFPYPNTDGQPVYAISRAAGHPADSAGDYGDGPAKYHKIPVSRDDVLVEEPIYGLNTIETGTPLLITEGIADAITAHEAGYPCISPVTTQFKHADRERLLDVLDTHDVPAVYVVQDAERPTSDIGDTDELTVEQVPPGLKGAVATSAYLDAHSERTDAAVAELPRPGLDKVDLDDYLTEWSLTLAPILASAKPASEHPAYEPKEHAIETASGSDRTDRESDETTATSGDESALFDLDIRDVTGMSWDDRGTNPLGHHGDSEHYFVLIEDRDVAYDHKYKVAYTALTYLLCEAGERRADSPNGRLDNEEMLAAWLHAKQQRLIPNDDSIPHRALVAIALGEDCCERDAIEDGWKLPREAYDAALTICRDTENGYGVDPGREPIGRTWSQETDEDDEERSTSVRDVDPTTLDVVVDPQLAWRAAKQTTPDDIREGCMETLALAVTDDGEAWTCPHCEGRVGVVQAVALDRGEIDCCEEPLHDEAYTTAYWHARTGYGAPLPDYVDAETATDNWALVQGAVSELTYHHFSGIESPVTGDGGNDDDVVAVINPCWADSASGERIVAFRSGAFYCREHERVLDPLRFVALEHEIIDHCDAALEGDDFTQTYHIAREQYGAPLPEWKTGAPDHIPVLPDADDLLGEFGTDKSQLDTAREETLAQFRDCAMDPLTAHVLTVLPALGKTTAGVILAEDYPLLYTGPRRELMQEVAEKAQKWGRTWMHLPIFSRYPANPAAVAEALKLVYEEGKHLLRERETLLERIDAPVNDEEDGDDADDLGELRDPETVYPTAESAREDGKNSLSTARREVEAQNREITRAREERRAASDEEDIELDRASCPTANGEHGDAWQLVVQVARMLGHSPKEIHVNDEALFGEELPCQRDGDCEYSIEWERALDPDNPKDILIGHYGHAHVEGARVHKARDEDEHVERTQRVVAIDEFPGDTFDKQFGEEFVDHAAWAAKALCPAIEDRQDIFEQKQELATDETLRAWIDGEATEDNAVFERLDEDLGDMATVAAAVSAAEQCRDTLTESDDEGDTVTALLDALDEVLVLGPEWTTPAIADAHAAIQAAVDDVSYTDNIPGQLVQRIDTDILTPLANTLNSLTDSDRLDTGTLPDRLGSDLTGLIEGAVTAFRDQREGARGLLQAAQTALAGGEDGCRELALHADDGYAHPMAYLLLHGLIADDTDTNIDENTEDEPPSTPTATGTRITTDSFDFGNEDDGTNLTQSRHDRQTILTDRNHRGAIIRNPPAFQDGSPNPVVGLDATGRESLWELAIGCAVETEDIHESPREKRAFLRDVLNMQVVQTSPHIQGYSGPPDSTNFDGPVALVNQIAEEYSASMLRRDTLSATTKPGVITTKKAETAIESRIKSVIGANEHYGDITGSNALGDHNLGIVLGSRHYSDKPVEKWAALAGETVTREGKGVNLDYNCSIGNTFLKHMREDQTLQAILRFGRDEEGAVVFVHTSALADCLPVVADGQVVKTFSENAHAITKAARQYRGERFEISDLVDAVDCSRETVRRTLNEQAALGYLTKHETKEGLANDYETIEEHGAGEVELPDLDDPFTPDGPPERGGESEDDDLHESPITRCYTWNVEVDAADLSTSPRRQSARATLPAPEKIAAGPPPN